VAKITTIIDIGSNSMRMVVFKKTSRFGFYLINETKSRVKISEGSYENSGNLQPEPMERAIGALASFLNIAKSLKSRKILCVATSALRDAPNKKEFLARVKKELGLNIKIIDGSKESYYGGVAALNLVHLKEFVTVDIGGGSTEFCFIKNGKIEDAISLDIGTVRLKELYFNQNDIDGAKEYILTELSSLVTYHSSLPIVVGIGGTIRALSRVIIEQSNYPLNVLHGFEYSVSENEKIFDDIIKAKYNNELKNIGIKKDRYDTIKEGTFIFKTILDFFSINKVVTSGVGVREGVYLTDLLRNSNHKFPSNFNVSIRSLLDRFSLDDKLTAYFGNNAAKIFDALKPLHNLDNKYKRMLVIASKLHSIGVTLNFYKYTEHAFNFILNGLNYDFSHEERVLVAHIIKFSKKTLPKKSDVSYYKTLLPKLEVLQWLSFMLTLNLRLNQDFSKPKLEYRQIDNNLIIKSDTNLYLAKSSIAKIEIPIKLKLKLESP